MYTKVVEWFGNSISEKDVADNWIHESFTSYAENLYNEYLFGKEAGAEYVIGTRRSVLNDKPIISPYDVNAGGSIDLYYKGANMLHTIRQLVSNDSLWRQLFLNMNKKFYHQTVTTAEIENFMTEFLKLNLQNVFNQYLRTTKLPVLEYKKTKTGFSFRYVNSVEGFNMPLRVSLGKESKIIRPTSKWQDLKSDAADLLVDNNYYVLTRFSE